MHALPVELIKAQKGSQNPSSNSRLCCHVLCVECVVAS